MSKITKSAKGQPCSLRLQGCSFNPEETVFAHVKHVDCGTAYKGKFDFGVYACEGCHLQMGNARGNIMPKEILLRVIAGLYETQKHLIKIGWIKLQ